jgi:hypothetical protein
MPATVCGRSLLQTLLLSGALERCFIQHVCAHTPECRMGGPEREATQWQRHVPVNSVRYHSLVQRFSCRCCCCCCCCSCRVDYILAHPDVLSVTAFKMGVRVTPQGVSQPCHPPTTAPSHVACHRMPYMHVQLRPDTDMPCTYALHTMDAAGLACLQARAGLQLHVARYHSPSLRPAATHPCNILRMYMCKHRS